MNRIMEISATSFMLLLLQLTLAAWAGQLQWAAGIEVAHRQIDAVGFQLSQEIRPDAGGAKAPVNIACFVSVLLYEAIDVLHLNLFALHAGYFTEAHDPALAVRQTLQLHHDRDGRRDLTANAADAGCHSSHGDHLFK